MIKNQKKKVILQIVKELNEVGISCNFKGNTVYFEFSNKVNPDISVRIWADVVNKDMFTVSFGMPNTNKLSRQELAEYVFSQEIGYTAFGVTEDIEEVLISIQVQTEFIDSLVDIICHTMLEIIPYIVY